MKELPYVSQLRHCAIAAPIITAEEDSGRTLNGVQLSLRAKWKVSLSSLVRYPLQNNYYVIPWFFAALILRLIADESSGQAWIFN